MSESFDFDEVGRFTVGAVGEPGRRVFYFQVFAAGTEVVVKCEKQQAQALADHLAKLLEELPTTAAAPVDPAEALPPDEPRWIVGTISLGIDTDAAQLVVALEELLDPEADDQALAREPAVLRVRLTPQQVQAFVAQVAELVAAGRPLCRLCERPIDPDGHACPRLN